ncbi:14028_t:CDS:1, partial [Cetraspora pellucida]
NQNQETDTSREWLSHFLIIFPPLGVVLERGCGQDLLINVLLTLLGFIP